MNLWHIYEYLVHVVNPFMVEKGECLYNALVRTIAEKSEDYLLSVRDAALNVVKMIKEDIAARQAERAEDELLDEVRPVWDEETPYLHVHWCPCVVCQEFRAEQAVR